MFSVIFMEQRLTRNLSSMLTQATKYFEREIGDTKLMA